jgi:hypothetical protein
MFTDFEKKLKPQIAQIHADESTGEWKARSGTTGRFMSPTNRLLLSVFICVHRWPKQPLKHLWFKEGEVS